MQQVGSFILGAFLVDFTDMLDFFGLASFFAVEVSTFTVEFFIELLDFFVNMVWLGL